MSIRTLSDNTPEPRRRPDLRLVAGAAARDQLPLDLEWEVSPGTPAVPSVPAGLRVVGHCFDPDGPDLSALPDPLRWVAQLAQAVSEVLVGERPAGQLTRRMTRGELARLSARAAAIARHPSARAQRGRPRARTVRAVRLCPVGHGVIEASAVLVGGERAQAIAVRMEAVGGRWVATVVDVR